MIKSTLEKFWEGGRKPSARAHSACIPYRGVTGLPDEVKATTRPQPVPWDEPAILSWKLSGSEHLGQRFICCQEGKLDEGRSVHCVLRIHSSAHLNCLLQCLFISAFALKVLLSAEVVHFSCALCTSILHLIDGFGSIFVCISEIHLSFLYHAK